MAEQNQPEEVVSTENIRNQIENDLAKRLHDEALAADAAQAAADSGKPVEAAVEAPEATETAPEEPAKPEMVKVKVEGHEYEVPKEQIDAEGGLEFYQKRAAANLIFQRAKQREDEANKLLADARQPKPQPQSAEQPNPVAQLIETIRFETDPEKAAAAVTKLVSQTQLTQQQVAGLVQQHIEADRAIGKFKTDFPEIAKDPLLYRMAVELENHARTNGNTEPNEVLHQKIGKLLSDKYVRPSGDFTEKKEKKATVTNIPQAKAKAQAPEAPKEKTVQEIIDAERRARKQM